MMTSEDDWCLVSYDDDSEEIDQYIRHVVKNWVQFGVSNKATKEDPTQKQNLEHQQQLRVLKHCAAVWKKYSKGNPSRDRAGWSKAVERSLSSSCLLPASSSTVNEFVDKVRERLTAICLEADDSKRKLDFQMKMAGRLTIILIIQSLGWVPYAALWLAGPLLNGMLDAAAGSLLCISSMTTFIFILWSESKDPISKDVLWKNFMAVFKLGASPPPRPAAGVN